MLSAYKNTAYVLLGGALCKAWQLIFSCFSLCALVKRCFQNQTIDLQGVDICDKLYGQPAEIEALLGYDFLEGRDWLLERVFRLLP